MKNIILKVAFGLIAVFLSGVPAHAQEANPVEAKLRESLRSTMLQLRKEQGERARLDAELNALKSTSEKEAKELKAKLEDALKRAAEEKSLADKSIAEQKKALELQDAQAAALTTTLDKWKAAHIQVSEIARKKEDERAGLQAKVVELERLVADRERKNLELFQLGNEILGRYEKFALGKALLAREPFTGITRVKLEEQVQDYKDKLAVPFASTGAVQAKAPAPLAKPNH